jgi:putative transcription factor
MNCEICGQPIRGRPVNAIVDKAKLMVCVECGKHSSGRWKVGETIRLSTPPLSTVKPKIRTAPGMSRERVGEELEVTEGFGLKIRQAREKLGISYEGLGKILNEKVSVIQRVESQKLVPDIKLTKKIEYALKIKLLGEVSVPSEPLKEPNSSEVTLGDVVAVKRRK